MAATEAALASSSPRSIVATTPPSRQPVSAISCSSPLPSPSQLLGMPSHSTKYGGTAIPEDTAAGFASASTLLRNARFEDDAPPPSGQRLGLADKYDLLKSGKIVPKPKKSKEQLMKPAEPPVFKKPPTSIYAGEEETFVEVAPVPLPQTETLNALPTKKNHKEKAAKTVNGQIETSDILPPKKTRKKKCKDEENVQTKIKKPRITKFRGVNDTTKKFVLPKKPKVDRSPERMLCDAVAMRRATLAPEDSADLGLEEAPRRRADWTPVRDTFQPESEYQPPKLLEMTSADIPGGNALPEAKFSSLLGEYAFADQSSSMAIDVDTMRTKADEVLAKKRKIELINGIPSAPPTVRIVPRTKSFKKKLQTITAKATEGFVTQSEADPTRPLTEYFMPPPETNGTLRSKKTKNPMSKPKKPATKAAVVLSPETAMTATKNQAFVFGTSSQLAREESPTFIREYNHAIKESESRIDSSTDTYSSLPLILSRSKSLALTPSRSLWSVANRNDEGSLLEAEFVNLADTPKAEGPKAEKHIAEIHIVRQNTMQAVAHDVWHDIADSSSPIKQPQAEPYSNVEEANDEEEASLPRSIAEKALKSRPRSVSPKKKAAAVKEVPDKMPNYQGYSDTKLRKEVKAYGFKPMQQRDAQIAMLEKCWLSKRAQALQELPANALLQQLGEVVSLNQTTENGTQAKSTSSSAAKKRGRPSKATHVEKTDEEPHEAPSKRPRGRPKKHLPATTPPVKRKRSAPAHSGMEAPAPDTGDEIYDSAPPTPSPPRRKTPSKAARTLTLSPSAAQAESKSPITRKSASEGRARLYAAMTHAVATQPPTHDPKNPSWYERMLMYEPIVIEDLASWFNVEGLAKVNEDDEVWTTLVKEWCESRSVCCLWKENLRGMPRARW